MAAYDGWVWPQKAGTNLRWNLWWGEGGEDANRRFLSILSLGSPKLPRAPPRPPAVMRAVGFWSGGWEGGGVEKCGERQTGLAYPGPTLLRCANLVYYLNHPPGRCS